MLLGGQSSIDETSLSLHFILSIKLSPLSELPSVLVLAIRTSLLTSHSYVVVQARRIRLEGEKPLLQCYPIEAGQEPTVLQGVVILPHCYC